MIPTSSVRFTGPEVKHATSEIQANNEFGGLQSIALYRLIDSFVFYSSHPHLANTAKQGGGLL